MRAALLSPLVPPVLVCVGIFSYTMLDILAGDAGMGSRRAIDLGLFLGTLVLVYGFVFSYASMFVFFIPCHIGLRILGVGGYFPYCSGRMRHLVTACSGMPSLEVLQPAVAAVHRLHMQIPPRTRSRHRRG